MIAGTIVILSIVFGVVFLLAYLTNPGLRRQIEQPKYGFQEQVQCYDRQCDIGHHEADGGSDESR